MLISLTNLALYFIISFRIRRYTLIGHILLYYYLLYCISHSQFAFRIVLNYYTI